MKKLNVRSKQVVAMVLFFVMTITAIQLPSFAASVRTGRKEPARL